MRHAGEVDVMAKLIDEGMLLQSARGPIPNVAELVAGQPIKGSWWGHPAGHAVYNTLESISESPDVVRLRLVSGKVTLVHRRLWPALVRVAGHVTAKQLAAPRQTVATGTVIRPAVVEADADAAKEGSR
jgi:hypothetical protein